LHPPCLFNVEEVKICFGCGEQGEGHQNIYLVNAAAGHCDERRHDVVMEFFHRGSTVATNSIEKKRRDCVAGLTL
jgi:hypothetical protein